MFDNMQQFRRRRSMCAIIGVCPSKFIVSGVALNPNVIQYKHLSYLSAESKNTSCIYGLLICGLSLMSPRARFERGATKVIG